MCPTGTPASSRAFSKVNEQPIRNTATAPNGAVYLPLVTCGAECVDELATDATAGAHLVAVARCPGPHRSRVDDRMGVLHAGQHLVGIDGVVTVEGDQDRCGRVDALKAVEVVRQRGLVALGGRIALIGSRRRPLWLAGTAALSLAKIGEKAQAMAIVRRLMARNDLSSDTLRLMFYASLEAGQDNEANSVLARMSRGTGTASRDVVGLQESLAIRQADRLREQKNLGAAYDVLVPYVSGASPSLIPTRA